MSEPAPAVPATDPAAEDVHAFLDAVLQRPGEQPLPPALIQKLFTVAVQHYSRSYDMGLRFPPMLGEHINATDVSTSCIEMLRVVDLEVFELTFWGGRLKDEPHYGDQ
jgi:hypothetical protein